MADLLFNNLAGFCGECVEVNRDFAQIMSATAIRFEDAVETLLELDSEFDEKSCPLQA